MSHRAADSARCSAASLKRPHECPEIAVHECDVPVPAPQSQQKLCTAPHIRLEMTFSIIPAPPVRHTAQRRSPAWCQQKRLQGLGRRFSAPPVCANFRCTIAPKPFRGDVWDSSKSGVRLSICSALHSFGLLIHRKLDPVLSSQDAPTSVHPDHVNFNLSQDLGHAM